jgi:hypothetical protein
MDRIVAGHDVLSDVYLVAALQALHCSSSDTAVQVQAGQDDCVALYPLKSRIQFAIGKCIETSFVNNNLTVERSQHLRGLVPICAGNAYPATCSPPVRQPPVVTAENRGPDMDNRDASFTATVEQRCRAGDQGVRRWLEPRHRQEVTLKVDKQKRRFHVGCLVSAT